MTVPIRCAGLLARQFCREVADATVAAVFRRSLYLRAGDRFLCIGAPEIGNGPFTLIGERGSDLGLRPGMPAAVTERHVTVGDIRFTLEPSETWQPPPWPHCPAPERLISTSAMLARRLVADAPPEALARQPFAPARIARYQEGLRDVRGLIGLGSGLTPSGDDFLVGALATLDALGEDDAHAALANAIRAALPGATSVLSAAFLCGAADRHVGEPLHRMVCAVMAGEVDAACATAASIGHSSGWDMLAGIASTLRTVGTTQSGQASAA